MKSVVVLRPQLAPLSRIVVTNFSYFIDMDDFLRIGSFSFAFYLIYLALTLFLYLDNVMMDV